jgi:predicted transcriptional regulator
MSSSLARISELWPSLSEATRQHISEVAEKAAQTEPATAEQIEGIAAGRADFAAGRVLSLDEFNLEMGALAGRLKSRYGARPAE